MVTFPKCILDLGVVYLYLDMSLMLLEDRLDLTWQSASVKHDSCRRIKESSPENEPTL